MTKKHTTFLTRNQVINAVRIDYEQYGFQLPLMQKLFPLITGNRIVISEDGRNSYLLIKRGKKSKTIRMNEAELIDYMINLLSESEIFIHRMADVCTLVFETHAEPENDPETGERGVRIETGMDIR